MAAKKKNSYTQCSTKGCRKKALSRGSCRVHNKAPVKKTTKKAVPRRKTTVKKKIKSISTSGAIKDICYEIGVALGKINRLVDQ